MGRGKGKEAHAPSEPSTGPAGRSPVVLVTITPNTLPASLWSLLD